MLERLLGRKMRMFGLGTALLLSPVQVAHSGGEGFVLKWIFDQWQNEEKDIARQKEEAEKAQRRAEEAERQRQHELRMEREKNKAYFEERTKYERGTVPNTLVVTPKPTIEDLRKIYSTAFLSRVEKHGTPDIAEPDELEGRSNGFDLEKTDIIRFGTFTRKKGFIGVYLYKEGEQEARSFGINPNISDGDKVYSVAVKAEQLRAQGLVGKVLVNFRVSDTPDKKDFGESFDSYSVWLFGNPTKQPDARINTGKTPYSTAFIYIL